MSGLTFIYNDLKKNKSNKLKHNSFTTSLPDSSRIPAPPDAWFTPWRIWSPIAVANGGTGLSKPSDSATYKQIFN